MAVLLVALLAVIEPFGFGTPPAPPDTYKEAFAKQVLVGIDAPITNNGVAFLVAWQQVENCRGHNPLCRLDSRRRPYRHASLEVGAAVVAATLDAQHPGRPAEWRHSYPLITAALRNADYFASVSQLIAAVQPELDKWCGPPGVCASAAALPYVSKVQWRAARYVAAE